MVRDSPFAHPPPNFAATWTDEMSPSSPTLSTSKMTSSDAYLAHVVHHISCLDACGARRLHDTHFLEKGVSVDAWLTQNEEHVVMRVNITCMRAINLSRIPYLHRVVAANITGPKGATVQGLDQAQRLATLVCSGGMRVPHVRHLRHLSTDGSISDVKQLHELQYLDISNAADWVLPLGELPPKVDVLITAHAPLTNHSLLLSLPVRELSLLSVPMHTVKDIPWHYLAVQTLVCTTGGVTLPQLALQHSTSVQHLVLQVHAGTLCTIDSLVVSDTPQLASITTSQRGALRIAHALLHCPALKHLELCGVALSECDISRCCDLRVIELACNKLIHLDFQHLRPCLERLVLNRNGLKDLAGVSNFGRLDTLEMNHCHLEHLSIELCPRLKVIHVSGNLLTQLHVVSCDAVTHIDCSYNFLTHLDVRHLPHLLNLQCRCNRLCRVHAPPSLTIMDSPRRITFAARQ